MRIARSDGEVREGFRAAIELRGFAMGRSRQPLSAPQQVHREKLQNTLRCLLTDFGVEPPPEGCPTRPGAASDDIQPVKSLKTCSVMRVPKFRSPGLSPPPSTTP